MALRHTPSLSWPMPRSTPSRSRHPKPDRRRALELLASCPNGCTEAIMLAHGFTTEMLVRLVRDGLASAKAEHMVAGGQWLEIARVKITGGGPEDARGAVTGLILKHAAASRSSGEWNEDDYDVLADSVVGFLCVETSEIFSVQHN
jgi:hypothetical protein